MYDRTNYAMIRPDILDAMDRWAQEHIPCGDFLMAVFRGDLFDAVGRADEDNQVVLVEICRYVFNELPSDCWGTREAVSEWETAEADPNDKRN